MANSSGLVTLVASVLMATSLGRLEAETRQSCKSAGSCCARVVQEPLSETSKSCFSYDLSSERAYSVAYFVSVNNDRLCRLVDVNKIHSGDFQLQLVEKGSSDESHYWRIIQLPYFLDNKEYDVAVVGADDRERTLDEIKPGDKTLKFYASAVRIPNEKKTLEIKPEAQKTFKDADSSELYGPVKNPPKNLFYKVGPRFSRDLPDGSFEFETQSSEGTRIDRGK